MKEKIIKLLEEKKDWISGEILALHLGISRSAVWKHIGELRKLGYKIEAGRKGYKLVFSPHIPYSFEVKRHLKTRVLGKEIYWFSSVDTTQEVAKKFAFKGALEGLVFVAEEQRRGRGRLGRDWFSPPGGLWFSLLLRPSVELKDLPLLSLLGGLAVVEAFTFFKIKSLIKWPNDVLVNGRKLAGVLVESESELDKIHFVIMGIGINCANPLPKIPLVTSIKRETGKEINRALFLAQILNHLEERYLSFIEGERGKIRREVEKHLAFKGEDISFRKPEGELVKGKLEGVGERGELIILTSGKRVYFSTGEILLPFS